jgi:hypothetical protein
LEKEINEVSQGIFIVNNYISKDTCNLLIDVFSKNLSTTPKTNILAGITGPGFKSPSMAGEYDIDSNYNIAIDMHSGILLSINDLISNIFKKPHQIKSYFFSCMLENGFNGVHLDNHYLDDGGNIVPIPGYEFDKSGILYLNDDYKGGEIFFPDQNLTIKPDAGSLIVFEGHFSKPHGVKEVKSGPRYNLVTFYEPVN